MSEAPLVEARACVQCRERVEQFEVAMAPLSLDDATEEAVERAVEAGSRQASRSARFRRMVRVTSPIWVPTGGNPNPMLTLDNHY